MTTILALFALVAAVANGLAVSPKHTSTKDWYETATFYQIYPRSFADSDGDGVGDIQGIISKLEHLKDIGVSATWLSPIFKSPMVDFGYDTADYYAVDEIFGTMADLEELFAKAKELGIKLLLDIVPNHTSDLCEWFVKSKARDPEYDDYYIWNDGIPAGSGQRPLIPNNWNNHFYGSAWTWVEERQQYYYHAFAKEMPDLNYRNPKVVEEMKNVFRFWLKKGAAGFRVDAVNFLFEVVDLRDEPVDPSDPDPLSYYHTFKDFTKNLDELYDIIYQFRTVIDEHLAAEGGGDTIVMMTEAYANTSKTMEYYQSQDGSRMGAHMPFNFVLLTELDKDSNADDFLRVINDRLEAIPDGFVTNWVIGNHDRPRVGTLYGTERIDALLLLVMTLPGIAVTYMGEEIGMVSNNGITFEQTKDPEGLNVGEENYASYTRDPARTPFQWDDTRNAGFSNGTVDTWLPIHPNYVWLNLKNQKGFKRSTYKFYKELTKLRENHIIIDGSFEPKVIAGNVLTYVRTLEGSGTMVVLINFASIEQTISVSDLTDVFADVSTLEIVVAGADSSYTTGDKVSKNEVTLRKHDAVVLMVDSSAASVSVSLILLITAMCKFVFA